LGKTNGVIKAFNTASDMQKCYLKVCSKDHPYGFLKFPETEAQELTEQSFSSWKGLLSDTCYEEPV